MINKQTKRHHLRLLAKVINKRSRNELKELRKSEEID